MKIKYSPLLYGRTYAVDFGAQFLTQPRFFTESDASWAFSVVSSSMDRSDFTGNDGRQVVFGNGKFVVVGLVTKFDELFIRCGREPEFNHLDRERGRRAHGFIGIVVPVKSAAAAFDIPMEIWPDLYCETMNVRWKQVTPGEPTKFDLREMDVEEADRNLNKDMIQAISAGYRNSEKVFLKNNKPQREEIVHCALSLALRGDSIVFCSDVDEIRPEYRNYFNVATCTNPEKLYAETKNVQDDSDSNIDNEVQDGLQNEVRGYDRVLEDYGGTQTRKAHKSQNSRKAEKPNKQKAVKKEMFKGQSRRKSVQSYDDVLESSTEKKNYVQSGMRSKTKSMDEEIERYNRTKKSNFSSLDRGFILGAAGGFTYCVIGAVNSADPVVLAMAGTATIIITGIEAKRIIDRL